MPKPYSTDLRERAVEAVESGASRREVAEVFEVGVSSVIRWSERDRERGSQTERREHLAARRALGMAFEAGCQTTRFDPQGDPCRHG
jgi:transposase